MRTIAARWLVVMLFVFVGGLIAGQKGPDPATPPNPRVDRVDYGEPDKYVGLIPSMGTREAIEAAAKDVKGEGAREKLVGIGAWIREHLKYDADAAYAWRDFDRMLADGTYGGCADHSLVFGALARACGIPTVWVKTMDSDWIRMFRRTHNEQATWSGHVFLEVHIDGKWALLDATQELLYADYDVRQRILPGDRYAYDKGGDPFELVLSTRWETWKEQTRTYFREFDLSVLPVPRGAPLHPEVFIAASNPEWDLIAKRCAKQGFKIGRSGNIDFDQWLPRSEGQILVVVYKAGKTVLPNGYNHLLPEDDLREAMKDSSSGVVRHTNESGTRVIVLFGPDGDSLSRQIDKLVIEE